MRGLLFLAFLPLALAARFAAFSVEPYGPQRVNLETGVTTLPQGGVIVDNENGLRLKGAYIEYKEGSFIRARKVELLSAKETFQAETLEHDIPKQEARFTGLLFSSPDFKGVQAQRALALFGEEVVVLRGQVRAQRPDLQGETLVVDLRAREGLVLGPFTYREGKATLRGQGPAARLYLRFLGDKVQATTRPPAGAARLEAQARLLP